MSLSFAAEVNFNPGNEPTAQNLRPLINSFERLRNGRTILVRVTFLLHIRSRLMPTPCYRRQAVQNNKSHYGEGSEG